VSRRISGDEFVDAGTAAFREALTCMDVRLDSRAVQAVEAWFRFYSGWPGRRVTGFVDPREAAVKLIADSFAAGYLAPDLPAGDVLDMGSGNGWPGLAVRLIRDDVRLLLLDSRLGACAFMRGFVEHSGLSGVSVVEARAEDVRSERALSTRFDLVTSRAMASPGISVELASAFLKIGGVVALWLGPEQEDAVDSVPAIPELGLERRRKVRYGLPFRMGDRVLAVYTKASRALPGYPRRLSSIRAKPLL
jgi:16S rRNA (guanine527-N7)-methyltransferase